MGAQVKNQPKITVGIMDRQTEVAGYLNGSFRIDNLGLVSGRFSAKAEEGMVVLTGEARRDILPFPFDQARSQEGFVLYSSEMSPLETASTGRGQRIRPSGET